MPKSSPSLQNTEKGRRTGPEQENKVQQILSFAAGTFISAIVMRKHKFRFGHFLNIKKAGDPF
jgi:hypothetical protein